MEWLSKLWRFAIGGERVALRESEAPAQAEPRLAKPATWDDVFRLAALLEQHGADYVLVGGYALNFNGLVRQTGDVDIVVRDTPTNNQRWIAALCELPDGAASELIPDANAPFPSEVFDDGGQEPGVIRVADEFIVDVMPKACGLSYDDLIPFMRRVTTESGLLNVLDLEGLRLTKAGVRAKDVEDRRHIEAALVRLRSRTTEHLSDMARRSFRQEPALPTAGRYELRTPLDGQDGSAATSNRPPGAGDPET